MTLPTPNPRRVHRPVPFIYSSAFCHSERSATRLLANACSGVLTGLNSARTALAPLPLTLRRHRLPQLYLSMIALYARNEAMRYKLHAQPRFCNKLPYLLPQAWLALLLMQRAVIPCRVAAVSKLLQLGERYSDCNVVAQRREGVGAHIEQCEPAARGVIATHTG